MSEGSKAASNLSALQQTDTMATDYLDMKVLWHLSSKQRQKVGG